jgi:hypothetical protein
LGVQTFRISSAMLPAMGLLFIFVGVMLKQARPLLHRHPHRGRCPVTAWDRTHRLGPPSSWSPALARALFPGHCLLAVLGPCSRPASSRGLLLYPRRSDRPPRLRSIEMH